MRDTLISKMITKKKNHFNHGLFCHFLKAESSRYTRSNNINKKSGNFSPIKNPLQKTTIFKNLNNKNNSVDKGLQSLVNRALVQ